MARNSTAATTPDDHADESEDRGKTQDDHGRHRLQAVSRRLLMSCLRDLSRRTGEVPQLIHFRIPHVCVHLIRAEPSVG